MHADRVQSIRRHQQIEGRASLSLAALVRLRSLTVPVDNALAILYQEEMVKGAFILNAVGIKSSPQTGSARHVHHTQGRSKTDSNAVRTGAQLAKRYRKLGFAKMPRQLVRRVLVGRERPVLMVNAKPVQSTQVLHPMVKAAWCHSAVRTRGSRKAESAHIANRSHFLQKMAAHARSLPAALMTF